jgi:hypothetical protein
VRRRTGPAGRWRRRAASRCARRSAAGQHMFLQPHRVRRFKPSQDRAFAAKLQDVVGLYLDPPAHSIVLSVDEKSQIQVLDRTQLGLPIKRGRAGTMTHDYIRHGTTTLFAALNVLDGTVIGQCWRAIAIRIHSFSEPHRGGCAGWQIDPRGPRQLCSPQAFPECAPGSPATRAGRFISRQPPARGPMRSRPSSPRLLAGASSAASSVRSSSSRQRSTATLVSTIVNPNRSSGPPIPTASSKRSIAGTKRSRQNTRSTSDPSHGLNL